jgi:hypothetical protein
MRRFAVRRHSSIRRAESAADDWREVRAEILTRKRGQLASVALIVSATLCGTAIAGGAQPPTEKQQVLDTVQVLIDAWREADVGKAQTVLHDDYRAESWQLSASGRHVFLETRRELLAQMAKLRPGLWDIHLQQTAVNIDSNGVAVVWARYEFYFDGKPDHCGHESYTLVHLPQGWKIINFADSDTPLRGRSPQTVCPGS